LFGSPAKKTSFGFFFEKQNITVVLAFFVFLTFLWVNACIGLGCEKEKPQKNSLMVAKRKFFCGPFITKKKQ
jgi:hypothetical protein